MQTPRKIPITDLGKEFEVISSELMPRLQTLLKSGAYVLGPELRSFERELGDYIGVPHAIGVNSGTDALWLAFKALHIGPGDEVIVPPMSFYATIEPLGHLGARPIFVDIDPRTYAIDASKIEQAITPRTKAIVAVHLYGLPADLGAISKIAKAKGLPLIEDMAQAIGSTFEGKKIGTWGDIACLSFYPTKNLGACGDAGAVLTPSTEIAERIRNLRNHGAPVKYHHEEAAYNTRLDDIQALILRLKLRHLDSWNEKRRTFARLYSTELTGLPLILPYEPAGRTHVYHLYTIQCDKRDALKAHLEQHQISYGLHYPIALHLLDAVRSLGYRNGQFPVSESLARQTLSLPLYPFMTADDVHHVCQVVRDYFERRS